MGVSSHFEIGAKRGGILIVLGLGLNGVGVCSHFEIGAKRGGILIVLG